MDTIVPLSGAREMDGVTLRKESLLGFIKTLCCCFMMHKADLCKETKSREKYITGLLAAAATAAAGGYVSGYKCLLSGKG